MAELHAEGQQRKTGRFKMKIKVKKLNATKWVIKVNKRVGSWADRHANITVAEARKLNAHSQI